jgi:hypothetical protein
MIKLEGVIFGHLTELNGKFKLRATEVTFAPEGYLGVHHHVEPGYDMCFPARLHSLREARRRSIKLGSTFLKRGTSHIPLRIKRNCRFACDLWRFFRKTGQLPVLFHQSHNELEWHLANIATRLADVSFWGNSGHRRWEAADVCLWSARYYSLRAHRTGIAATVNTRNDKA